VALAASIFSLVTGSRELSNSKRLADHGLSTSAEVLDSQMRVSFRSGNSYSLTVEFQPKDAAKVHAKLKVTKETYNAAQNSSTVNVFYLPENPDICAAGNKVVPNYSTLILGIGFLALAALLIFTLRRRPQHHEAVAEKIEASLKPLQLSRHEYAPANPANFPDLDLAFYDQTQKFLEAHGYTCLGDKENVTLRKTSGLSIFIRVMASEDKTVMAGIYHFKRKSLTGVTKEAKILDLATWLNINRLLTTSNAQMTGHLSSPPTIDACHLPGNTPVEQILQTHLNRFQTFTGKHPGVQAYGLSTLEEVQMAQDELQRVKADYRSHTILSKAELERIADRSSPELDQVHATLAERQAEQRANQK